MVLFNWSNAQPDAKCHRWFFSYLYRDTHTHTHSCSSPFLYILILIFFNYNMSSVGSCSQSLSSLELSESNWHLFQQNTDAKRISFETSLVFNWLNWLCMKSVFSFNYVNTKNTLLIVQLFLRSGDISGNSNKADNSEHTISSEHTYHYCNTASNKTINIHHLSSRRKNVMSFTGWNNSFRLAKLLLHHILIQHYVLAFIRSKQ